MTTRTPAYKIVINDKDKTDLIADRFISLTLSDAGGFEADQLDLELDDHDGQLAMPSTKAVIEVWLGFKGEPLVPKGVYNVDEVEHAGPPDRIIVRARSADFRTSLIEQKTRAWDNVTLGDIINTISTDHDLDAAISDSLSSIAVAHIDQTDESDAHFLTRLAADYDAIATVKSYSLLFLKKGLHQSASGNSIKKIFIDRADAGGHAYQEIDRDGNYTGVMTRWLDKDSAKLVTVLAGAAGKVKTIRNTYKDETAAINAAKSEYNNLLRKGASMEIALSNANLELIPETPVTLTGWRPEIIGKSWSVGSPVTHELTSSLVTRVTLIPAKE